MKKEKKTIEKASDYSKLSREDKDSKQELEKAKDFTRIALESPIQQESDLKGVMKELNEDTFETEAQLPSIDLKTRLQPYELSSIIIHDTVINLGCLPKECLITTRNKKRLAVSLKGEGRKEMVQIVQGERAKEAGLGFANKLKGLFTPADKG